MIAPWPPAGVKQRLADLRSTRRALRTLADPDDYVTEQCMARYLTVRSAGYLEAVRDDVADQFVSTRAAIEVTTRVRTHLRTGLGVNPAQLTAFLGSFVPNWAEELSEYLGADDAHLSMNLGALVKARKQVAHGDGETVTTGKAITWSETAETIGKWLISRFDPSTPITQAVYVGS